MAMSGQFAQMDVAPCVRMGAPLSWGGCKSKRARKPCRTVTTGSRGRQGSDLPCASRQDENPAAAHLDQRFSTRLADVNGLAFPLAGIRKRPRQNA